MSFTISNRTIQNLEGNKTNPRLDTIITICENLDIDPREFICPEKMSQEPHVAQLNQIVADCTKEEAAFLIPALVSLKQILRHNSEKPSE